MTDGERINVIEFNVRFAHPECEPLMMRLDSDSLKTCSLLLKAKWRTPPSGCHRAVRSRSCSRRADIRASTKKGIAIRGLDRLEGNVPSDIKIKWAMKKDSRESFPLRHRDARRAVSD